MRRNLVLNIALSPVINHDTNTDRFIIYYEEFPQAIATGHTKVEAENNLIGIVEVMWKERRKELGETLLKNYIKDIHQSKSSQITIQ